MGGLMLKLNQQYFGHLMQRTDSFEKTLKLEKIEGRRRRGWQRIRWLDGITKLTDMRRSKLRELVMDGEAWHAAAHGITKNQSNWTELANMYRRPFWQILLYGMIQQLSYWHTIRSWPKIQICHSALRKRP